MCMCVCECVYVCMHVCMYYVFCMYLSIYLCIYLSMYLCTYLCMYREMHLLVNLCMQLCMHLCMHLCMFLRMYLCMYLCMDLGRKNINQRGGDDMYQPWTHFSQLFTGVAHTWSTVYSKSFVSASITVCHLGSWSRFGYDITTNSQYSCLLLTEPPKFGSQES